MATGMMQAKPESTGTYTYSSHPRAVQQGKKYREQSAYGNIMYDKRIVRGNTYALHTLPASSQPDPLELQRQQESRRRALARKRAREQFKPRSPEPVEGRKHIEVQTELYLEEITDRVEEADVQTQTDAFLDRPSTPLFVPAKTGMDAATQIQEGDLFDFDIEVGPILEVIVGKTVEQALLEVMEEEELASLRAQQRLFEENRNAEVVETQRLEEQERRRREEKDRRMQQQREAILKEKETAERIAARAFAQSYLADLVPSVFSTLNQNGFFYDPVEREVETVFMPFLMEETEKSLHKKLMARTLLDAIVRNVVAQKLGIELVDPEPPAAEEATPPSPPPPTATTTQEEQTHDTQQQEKEDSTEQKKVFGDPKEGEGEAGQAIAGEGEGGTTPAAGENGETKEEKEGESEEGSTGKDEPKEGEDSKAVTDGDGQTADSEDPPQDTKEGETELQQQEEKPEIEGGKEKVDEDSKEKEEGMSKEGEESESQPVAEGEATPTTETNAESAEGPPVASDDQS